MSYILEALKQSEYQRQQGKVPPLNTLPSMIQPPVEPPARRVLPYLLLAGMLLAMALAWWRPWPAAEQIRSIAVPYTAPPGAADVPAVRQQSPAAMAEPALPAASVPVQPGAAPPVPPICHPARTTGC